MKNVLLALGVVFVFGTFSGCGVREEFQADANLVSVSGRLIEQTTKDKESGTHFIVDGSEKKTSVRSLTINLSGEEYLNNKVKVKGIMNQADNVLEITGISVEEILSQDTKQVQQLEYKDSEAGFKLTYFDDWKVSTGANGSIVFTAPLATGSTASAIVRVEQKPFKFEEKALENGTAKTALQVYYEGLNGGKSLDLNSLNKIGTDQMSAIKSLDGGKIRYTLYRFGLIYDLVFEPGVPANPADEVVFNKMLADFQFIAVDNDHENENETEVEASLSADTAELIEADVEMTSFESLPYKFSGSYPAKWYYAGVKTTSDKEVLHHYGFSDKVITQENELIGLDVLSGAIPDGGNSVNFAGKNLKVLEGENYYKVYVSVGDINFRVVGPASYKEVMLLMAASLNPVNQE